jgi:hypothetical protein
VLYALRYLSFRYWLRHRGAFALATLGVALGIAVFVAIQIANASVLGAFGASVDAVAGKSNLQIRGGASGLPDKLFAQVVSRDDEAILAAAPALNRTLFSPSLKTTILVAGIDVFSEIDFRPRDLESVAESRGAPARDTQAATQFLLEPDAIAVSGVLARKHDLKIGSKLALFIGSARRSFRVAQVLDDEASGRAFGGDYAILDIASAQEAFGEIGTLSNIDLIVDESSIERVTRELETVGAARCFGFATLSANRANRRDAWRVSAQPHRAFVDCRVRRRVSHLQRARLRRLFVDEAKRAFCARWAQVEVKSRACFWWKPRSSVSLARSPVFSGHFSGEIHARCGRNHGFAVVSRRQSARVVRSRVAVAVVAWRGHSSQRAGRDSCRSRSGFTSPRATLSGGATLHHALERGAPKLLLGALRF